MASGPLLDEPTAVHAAGEVHDTPCRVPPGRSVGPGVVWTDHCPGDGGGPAAQPTAASALTIGAGWPLYGTCSENPAGRLLRAPLLPTPPVPAVPVMQRPTSSAVSAGFFARASAATPATIGAD